MNGYLSVSNIYWNRGLRAFFFRDQAYKTLERLVNGTTLSGEETLRSLDEQTEDMDCDEVEEMFYSESLEWLANYFDLELEQEDEDDDEE